MVGTSTIYDTPDGKDCLQKTVDTSLYAGKVGALWSIGDMILRTKPTNAVGIARTFVYWTGPAAAMGATYAATSCLVGGLREKDSPVNHIIGGAAAMSIVGMRSGPKTACLLAIPISLLAGLFKTVKISGYDIVPDHTHFKKEFGAHKHYARHYGPRTEVTEPTNY